MEVKIIGASAVPLAMIFPPRATTSIETEGASPALALITVPGSMVSVTPEGTVTC